MTLIVLLTVNIKLTSAVFGNCSQNTSRKYCGLKCDSSTINIVTSKETTTASQPDEWRSWTALCHTKAVQMAQLNCTVSHQSLTILPHRSSSSSGGFKKMFKLKVWRNIFKLTALTPTDTYMVDILDAEGSSPCAMYRCVLCRKVMCTFCCVLRNWIVVTGLVVMGFNLLNTKRNLLYIRNQSVPHSKQSPSLFSKPIT
jgi:hypothetical protein